MNDEKRAAEQTDGDFYPLMVAAVAATEIIRNAAIKLPVDDADRMYAMAYSYLTVGHYEKAAAVLDFLAITGNGNQRVDTARAFIAWESGQYLQSALHYYSAYQYNTSDFEAYKASLKAIRQYVVTSGAPLHTLDNWVQMSDEIVRQAAADEVQLMKASLSSDSDSL